VAEVAAEVEEEVMTVAVARHGKEMVMVGRREVVGCRCRDQRRPEQKQRLEG
jgi:hypothetical protein